MLYPLSSFLRFPPFFSFPPSPFLVVCPQNLDACHPYPFSSPTFPCPLSSCCLSFDTHPPFQSMVLCPWSPIPYPLFLVLYNPSLSPVHVIPYFLSPAPNPHPLFSILCTPSHIPYTLSTVPSLPLISRHPSPIPHHPFPIINFPVPCLLCLIPCVFHVYNYISDEEQNNTG